MTHRTQTRLWAAVAALGLLAAPVLGQGVRSDYTQTPEGATRDLNTDIQTINPNAESNVPGDRTDMSTDAQGGVYQPPANRATDRSSDPDTVSDYQVSPNDLVMGSDGMNIRNTQGTVSRGNGTTINRTDRETQMQRNREQRGERRGTTTRGARRGGEREDRVNRGGAAGAGSEAGGARGSAITPWVTNPGRDITPPGTVVPGTTAPGGVTTPGSAAPGGVTTPGSTPGTITPGTTAPGGVTTPGTTTPGTTTPGATTPGASPGAGGTAGGSTGGASGGATGGGGGR